LPINLNKLYRQTGLFKMFSHKMLAMLITLVIAAEKAGICKTRAYTDRKLKDLSKSVLRSHLTFNVIFSRTKEKTNLRTIHIFS